MQVLTNFAPLKVEQNLSVYQYDVIIEPQIKDAERRRKVIEQQGIDQLLGNQTNGWAYNSDKILYTTTKLSLPHGVAGWTLTEDEKGFCRLNASPGVSAVTILYTKTISFDQFGASATAMQIPWSQAYSSNESCCVE